MTTERKQYSFWSDPEVAELLDGLESGLKTKAINVALKVWFAQRPKGSFGIPSIESLNYVSGSGKPALHSVVSERSAISYSAGNQLALSSAAAPQDLSVFSSDITQLLTNESIIKIFSMIIDQLHSLDNRLLALEKSFGV